MKIFLYFTFFLLFLVSCNNASIDSSFTSLNSAILDFQNIDSSTVINPNLDTNYTITGSCQSSAGLVTLSINDDFINQSADCINNQFSSTVSFVTVPNGLVKILISQMDPVTQEKNSALLTISKLLLPVASLSGSPTTINNTTLLNVTVGGPDVFYYQYKFGLSATTICSVYLGYSVDIAVGNKITDALSDVPDGDMTLCVLGKNNLGTYQLVSSATSTTWKKDTTAPIIEFLGAPIGTNSTTTLNISLKQTDVEYYKYKIGDNTLDCSISSGYSASEVAVTTNITDSISTYFDGIVKVCAVGRDSAGNYQQYSSASSTSWTKNTSVTTAIITGQPTSPSNTSDLEITVSGTGVTHYKYKVGLSSSTLCGISSGYSADIPIATKISDNLPGIIDDSMTLCVLGKNNLGTYQLVSSPTSASWVMDTKPPAMATALSLLSPLTSPNLDPRPTISIEGVFPGDTLELYKNDSNCSPSNLVSTGIVSAAQTTIGLQTSSNLSDGSYEFYAKSIDPLDNTLGCSSTSVAYLLDTVAPTAPTGVALDANTVARTETPIISWAPSSDANGIASYQVQIFDSTHTSVGSLVTLTSGNKITGLNLSISQSYYVKIHAIDNAGNISAESQSTTWTASAAAADPCSATSPAIGVQCADGTYYAGSITLNSVTYKLATTPGGCGYETGGSAASSPSAYFTPTCTNAADFVTKNAVEMTPVEGADQIVAFTGFTNPSTVRGSTSTKLIIDSSQNSPGYAYCHYMDFAGNQDWFLPNKTELHMMACHGTTSSNPLPGLSNEYNNCNTFGYGDTTNIIPGFISGKDNAASYTIYGSSTTINATGAPNLIEQTVNGNDSGNQSGPSVNSPYKVRCARIIP